jgi:hypothetical protein
MLPSVAISCHQLPSVAVWINNVTGSLQTAAGVVSRYQISYLIIWFRCLDHRPISHRTIGTFRYHLGLSRYFLSPVQRPYIR